MFNFIWLKPWQLNAQLCSYCILEDQGTVLVYAVGCAVYLNEDPAMQIELNIVYQLL
jgi:hypothetical protein